MVAAMRV
jgi:hypothetical protein